MTGNPGGIQLGASIFTDYPDVLGSAADGCKSWGILQVGIPELQGGDTGVPAATHHLQCGGECGGAVLVQGDGRGRWQADRMWIGGKTPKFPLLRG